MTSAREWTKRIDACRLRHEDAYLVRAQKILDKYRNEKSMAERRHWHRRSMPDSSQSPKMNLLYSNTETLKPAMYSSMPSPVAKRRHMQDDPIAREGSDVLEKALAQSMDNGRNDFDLLAAKIVEDYLLPGRSVDRAIYRPVDIDGDVAYEEIDWHHVPWMWFCYDPQSRWEDVDWVAYGDHFFARDELKKRFSLSEEKMAQIPVNVDEGTKEETDIQVWEIWSKPEKKVFWHVHGHDEILLEEAPPVKLINFYDCPCPLYSIPTNDSLIPVPEYTQYQYQAEEINDLTVRIDKLISAIRANGLYAGEQKLEIDNLLKSNDGLLIPVADWGAIIERGGIEGMISWVPIEQFAKVLQILTNQRQILIQQIYDLTGISDLMRGSTDPRETRGAQMLKANFGARRIQPRQRAVQKYIRDILRIAAEIIVEKFDRSTVEDMTGIDIQDATWQLLRDDADRVYAIDIETDSTIAIDDRAEKQAISEFMTAIANFIPVAREMVASGGPEGAKVAGSILLWAMRRFRAGREVEEAVESLLRNPPPPAPPPPDPALIKVQAAAQARQQELQQDQAETQARIKIETMETLAEIQRKQAETDAKIEQIRRLTAARVETERARAREVEEDEEAL